MISGHGGDLAAAVLRRYGVTELFTVSGGDVLRLSGASGMRLVGVADGRTAVFAAEAVARLRRRPGFAVLPDGPAVTGGVAAIAVAYRNGSPVVVLGGRDSGGVPEADPVAVVSPVTRYAGTVTATDRIPDAVRHAVTTALTPHRGPVLLDVPREVWEAEASVPLPEPVPPETVEPDDVQVARAAALIGRAERPMVIAGSDVWTGGAVAALRECAESLRIPVYADGMARGCLPPSHPLAFSRSRHAALGGADVVVVIGAPSDAVPGSGDIAEAQLVHIVDAPGQPAGPLAPAVAVAGDLCAVLEGIAEYAGVREDHAEWVAELRTAEDAAAELDRAALADDREPIRSSRIYGELRRLLDPGAVLVVDGFSEAERYLRPEVPGCWLEAGAGSAAGYATGARVAYPDRQVCLLTDAAAPMELVRQRLPVLIVGTGTDPLHDQVVDGETVTTPGDLAAAFRRGLDRGAPYLVSVLTDRGRRRAARS